MALGEKTRRYLQSKRDPGGSVWGFIQNVETMASGMVKDAIQRTVTAFRGDLESEMRTELKKILTILGNMPAELRAKQEEAIRAHIDAIPHLKGDAGYTPIKGVDYRDGEDGLTPEEGVDYVGIKRIEERFVVLKNLYINQLEERGLTKAQIIEELKNPDAAAMARAIEALAEEEKLDYYRGLKRQPEQPAKEVPGNKAIHRGGGGKQTYEYDLSSLCDGATRIFTIPTNTRVVLVQCTDTPSGILRKTVDWTGTGTTTLTLSNNIAAPSLGATLNVLYVV